MADDDFDIQRLAAYLHVDPAQVARLADRGRLPGRKVGGQWRFSPASIHHWLEERMGLSTDDELKQLETAMRRPPGRLVEAAVSLAALLPLEAIAIPLAARTRQSVIASMCDLAAQTGWLWDPAKMSDAVRAARTCVPRHSTTAPRCCIRGGRCRQFWIDRFWRWGGQRRAFPSAARTAR